MSISPETVLAALSQVEEPDLKKDLVTLNMIRNIQISGKRVSFEVVLTTPACPLKEMIKNACITAIHHLVDKEAEVEPIMTAEVTSHRQNRSEVLPGVKNIIAVASGKGGVGKSSVAMNLAVALSVAGSKVGLMDADIYGPSLPLMSGLEGSTPLARQDGGKQWIQPLERFGIKLMSIGFLVPSTQALVWRGPMASKALGQFITDVEWGELDYLIVDLPPGTGDIHLTLTQQLPVTGALIVTTPQPVAVADARKGLAMFQHASFQVPVLGIIENMSWFIPLDNPEKKYTLFGEGGGLLLSIESGVPLLGQIPLTESIRVGGDIGMPGVLDADSPAAPAFHKLASAVAQQVAIVNANASSAKVN
jgi:ATP-binding protein involved in chromosome partitioning